MLVIARLLTFTLIIFTFGAGLAAAQEDTYTGRLDNQHPSDTYTFEMEAGQAVLIEARATSGDLDTYLRLNDPDGNLVAENDDRNDDSLDSVLGFTAIVSGVYSVTVSPYEGEGTSGKYELTINVGDSSVLEPLIELTSLSLSGPARLIDTEHFRIHYTLSGVDAADETFANQAAEAMEQVWEIEIEQLGWPAPPSDGISGGDDRIDVYLIDMLDDEGYGALGIATPGDIRVDNPNTPEIESNGSFTTIQLENDFAETEDSDKSGPVALMRATAAHEFHHAIQHGLDAEENFTWYFEATATWMETIVFPKNQAAVGYVDYNFDYPELCFGTESDPDGLLMYGDWMFMQSLTDAHGHKVVRELWTDIADYDGWAALEQTLAAYEDTIPEALARYRVQNLVRDYKFATYFGNARVYMENNINKVGRWTFSGDGIEELGANYYGLTLEGNYQFSLIEDDNTLELWAVGVRDKQADTFRLGHEGSLSTAGYDHMYLMVFNPSYHDDVNDCSYSSYAIQVTTSKEAGTAVEQTWNARYFSPLKR